MTALASAKLGDWASVKDLLYLSLPHHPWPLGQDLPIHNLILEYWGNLSLEWALAYIAGKYPDSALTREGVMTHQPEAGIRIWEGRQVLVDRIWLTRAQFHDMTLGLVNPATFDPAKAIKPYPLLYGGPGTSIPELMGQPPIAARIKEALKGIISHSDPALPSLVINPDGSLTVSLPTS